MAIPASDRIGQAVAEHLKKDEPFILGESRLEIDRSQRVYANIIDEKGEPAKLLKWMVLKVFVVQVEEERGE